MGLLNKVISQIVPYLPKQFVAYFSQHYIAGEFLEDAVRVVQELMAQGMCATIDVLGEEVTHKDHALTAVDMYLRVLETIHTQKLDSNISVKPTHMGLEIDRDFCFQNLRTLVEAAKKYNNFVRIDMEDSTCTEATIEFYEMLRKEFDNVGTVLQAYMRRTIDDINRLLPLKPNLRICKGIYVEPREIAYKDKAIINKNYTYAVEKLIRDKCYVGIATHDEKLVWEGLRMVDQYQLQRDQYEFQMLLGVDTQLRRILVNHGHRLRVYVPFGKEWFAYSTRRLKENPNIVGHIFRNTINRIRGRHQ